MSVRHNHRRKLKPADSRTQTFSGNAIKPPISAAVAGTGNSSVFRHAVLGTGLAMRFVEIGPHRVTSGDDTSKRRQKSNVF
jgi:hypothetical protein